MQIDSLPHWLQLHENLLLLIALGFGIAIIGIAALVLTLAIANSRNVANQRSVLIEITPPAQTNRTTTATQRLFSVLHGMEHSRSTIYKLLRRRAVFSAEIVGTKEQGIRYVLRVPAREADSFENILAAYLPEVKYTRGNDYIPDNLSTQRPTVISFGQTGHFAYPLQTQDMLEDHDPIGYLNGTMTHLKSDELIVFQVVTSPIKSRKAGILQNRLAYNESFVTQLNSRSGKSGFILNACSSLLETIGSLVSDIFHGPSRTNNVDITTKTRRQEAASRIKPVRTLSAIEQNLANKVQDKLERPLFAVDIRAMIIMHTPDDTKRRVKDIQHALDAYKVPKYQALKRRRNIPLNAFSSYRFKQFRHRLPSLFVKQSSLLSDTELAGIYHFPHSVTAKTENVIKSLSKQLPAPISLKNGTPLDVLLGRNYYHGQETDIGLTEAERERHLYIIGGTGNGKTTMLFYSILQDIKAGKGVAVLDPHGDLAERILRYIPNERIADVIYMNPDDLAYPIAVNLLEIPENITGDDLLREKDLVTEATISVLRKVFSDDDSGGHRIEYVLRNSIQTVLTLKNPTLFTIFELLNDATFRRKVTSTLKDKYLKDFWDNELGKAGEFQRVKMAAGITAKIGRFLFSASAKRILEQPHSTINFEDILASKKILICNFSKGLLGEDTSALFGTTVLSKLQTAALRRAKMPEQDRVPFYVYVDEFQNFATTGFVQMLSEARKYKLYLTMAEQSTSQQDQERLVDIILANVGSLVCFRSGSPADERRILPLFSPYVEQGEIANLPAFSYFVRIAAINAQEPMSGMTVVIKDHGSEAIARQVIESSRRTYARVKTIQISDTATTPVLKTIRSSRKSSNVSRKRDKSSK